MANRLPCTFHVQGNDFLLKFLNAGFLFCYSLLQLRYLLAQRCLGNRFLSRVFLQRWQLVDFLLDLLCSPLQTDRCEISSGAKVALNLPLLGLTVCIPVAFLSFLLPACGKMTIFSPEVK